MTKRLRYFLLLSFWIYFLSFFFHYYEQNLIENDFWFSRLSLELCALILLQMSAYGVGRIIFKGIYQREAESGIEKLGIFGFGLLFLSYLGFFLASSHLLRWEAILPSLAFLSFLGFFPKDKRELRNSDGLVLCNSKQDYLVGLLVIFFMSLIFIQALGPPIHWDDQVYHLVLPKLYLARKGFYHIPFNVCSAFPQNLEVLYALVMSLSNPIAGVLVHYSIGVMVLLMIYQLGKKIFGNKSVGLWGIVFFSFSGIFMRQASSAYIELGTTLMVLLSLGELINFRENQGWRSLLSAGIFAGGALGIKYLALGSVIANALLVLLWSEKQKFLKAIVFLAVAFCFLMPWLVKNQVLTGNPFYPFLPEIFGSAEWDKTMLTRYVHSQMMIGMAGTGMIIFCFFPGFCF